MLSLAMTPENHSKGYFQQQYISACELIGEPLTKNQVSTLESTIYKIFSPIASPNQIPSSEISEKIDKFFLYKMEDVGKGVATQLLNNLHDYGCYIKIEKPETNMTNKDALDFYRQLVTGAIRLLEDNQYLRLTIGKKQTEVLAKYLLAKGIITQKDIFPLAPR